MNLVSSLAALHQRLLTITGKLSFLAPLLLRVTVGVVFIATGWGKLTSLDDVTQFFASLGIPLPGLNARIAASTEFFGGILILVGLGARLVALPMAFTMVVAIATAKRAEIDGLVTFLGFQEWDYLVAFLVVALLGPGAWSLDAVLAKRFARSSLSKPLLHPAAAPNP